MARERLVNVDRDTPMLLPPDLREWVRDDDLANFLLAVIEGMDLSGARINPRGTGNPQYPPSMMLAVLIYSYATGVFSSRQIERLTHQHVSVRYLAANCHPDHDTICTFRRENGALLKAAFAQVLRLAAEVKLGQVGTICVDGTKIMANAAKRRTFNDEELRARQASLDLQIEELLAKAQSADAQESQTDGTSLPEELRGRQRLREQVAKARQTLAEQSAERARAREADRAAWKQNPIGDCPEALPATPAPSDRINLSDQDSRLMPQGRGKPYVQGYNAQAAVSAEPRALIVGTAVSVQTNDRQQLAPVVTGALEPAVLAGVERVVADSGYDHARQIAELEQRGLEVICPPQGSLKARMQPAGDESKQGEQEGPMSQAAAGGGGGPGAEPEQKKNKARQAAYRVAAQSVQKRMKAQATSEAGQRWLRVRRMTVEPVFGLIKSVLGFGRFRLRGLAKVQLEWKLVAVAFNCRRVCHLYAQAQGQMG